MPSVTIENEIPCTEEDFWSKTFFEEEWNRRFYLEILKFPEWKVLEQTREPNGAVKRRVHLLPQTVGLPGPLKKVMGDKFSYIEEGTYDPAKKQYDYRVIPSVMPEKTNGKGRITTRASGNKVLRTAHVDIEVKVFMVGGMLEEKILNDFRQSSEEAAKFSRVYVKEKGFSTE